MLRRIKGLKKTRSNKVLFDGIQFSSGLEKYMYQCLKNNNIEAAYEGETFILIDSFHFYNTSYERQANSKGEFKNRGSRKVRAITYTPDFVGNGFIIETKGNPNEAFPLRWKLFKKLISEQYPDYILYKPQIKKECDRVIQLILNKE